MRLGVMNILQKFKKGLLYKIDKKLREAFNKIKEEFEDHLLAINENTNEIQANYEYLCEIDTKIDKLNERLDEISMFIGLHPQKYPVPIQSESVEIDQSHHLTRNEQEVFIVLYTLGEEKSVTYRDIAKQLNMSETLVMNYITNIIEKGVPVIKDNEDNEIHLRLDPEFKNLQAKQNILNINETVSAKVIS